MSETKLVKAFCDKTNKHFAFEVLEFKRMLHHEWKVVNMLEISDKEAKILSSEVKQDSFVTNENLQACKYCGNRKVGGCNCTENKTSCSRDMKYQFNCIYCSHMKLDYSVPKRKDLRGVKEGDTVTLDQGKEVKVVTFDDEEWVKFDNIKTHPRQFRFIEPRHHVLATGKNIEFHGYHVSEMDEGVYLELANDDDFEIRCTIDATKISPHPGGYFYIYFGRGINAMINEKGGQFTFADGKRVDVGARFNMKLILKNGCHYQLYINDRLEGEVEIKSDGNLSIVFGFQHGAHCCNLLSHAYVKDIEMKIGYTQ